MTLGGALEAGHWLRYGAGMEPLVDTVIEDDRWEAFGLEPLANRAVRAAFAEMGLPEVGFTLCVMGCDDARILELNGDFRGKAKPTNVLSWPSEERGADEGSVPELPEPGDADDPESLGDIAISYDTCATEALAADKPMADHVTHLTVHGLLHLLGYDHINDSDAELMQALEVRILARMGLSDPY
jgi:probable rRNA maturation factor